MTDETQDARVSVRRVNTYEYMRNTHDLKGKPCRKQIGLLSGKLMCLIPEPHLITP